MTANQLRMARSSLRLTVRELARLADINHMTINRFETEKGGLNHTNAEKIRKVLEAKNIQFLEAGDIASGDGIALKRLAET